MLTFLEETLNTIKKKHSDLSSIIFIFPSKRAGGFLKNYLKHNNLQTSFAPKIISIEEFIEELSDIKIIDTTELLFKSYDAYISTSPTTEKDDFEVYVSWATTLLNDFNEIDRYLIPPKQFFSYLNSIQDINHWYVQKKKTILIENYLSFWNSLYDFYKSLKQLLLKEGFAYQGLVYREAAESLEHYILSHGNKTHIFIGFNALNSAEQTIIQELLEIGNTEIFWDIDSHFYNDPKHTASYFIRKYTSEWKYYNNQPPKQIANNFETEKIISLVQTQKNIGQVKYIGQLLSKLSPQELSKTAIVLADEQFLKPLLYSLPPNVKNVNITMGILLKGFPSVVFFELLLSLHLNPTKTLYYKDVLAILNHPLATGLLSNTKQIVTQITKENLTYLSLSKLIDLDKDNQKKMLQLIFGDWQENSTTALKTCKELLIKLKKVFKNNSIEKVVLYELYNVFNKVEALNNDYLYLKKVKTVQNLFSELIAVTSIDFKGDAFHGLQIMGVLETRVLDFENIIIASVNEGVLPSGKSNSSFITYDLKQQFGLPLYTEKDAIYTYHFYRLLHRANNITLLYSNYTEGLNTGEKSRYISQLEIENYPKHTINKIVLTPSISVSKSTLKNVVKTDAVMERLKDIANKGFSPSSLTNYIRNPLDFYYQKILKINEINEVEETVAANTLGTIVHDTLEVFYKPLEGKFLSSEVLLKIKKQIDDEVTRQFKRTFKGGLFSKGKNLLIFEVAKRFVSNFIKFELSEIKAGNQIKIVKIENTLEANLTFPKFDFPMKIRGKIDRLDEYNGTLRIIDYKTGQVKQSDLEIIDWVHITSDYKYGKVFQVLAYAFMIQNEIPFEKAQAGVISFKNLTSGFLKYGQKTSMYSREKNQEITPETIENFITELKKLILEIFDPNIPFIEKEI